MTAIRTHQDHTPQLGQGVYIDPAATIIGDVTLGAHSNVWPGAIIRGDMHFIRIGERTSIQDNSVLHITHASTFNPDGYPLIIGDDVTVGHQATLHGCTLGNRILVGIGAIVLDGAVVEDDVVIAAGTLVPPGKRLRSGYMYKGAPCQQARPLTERERTFFTYSAANYVRLKDSYLAPA